jgi:hypothetical protein
MDPDQRFDAVDEIVTTLLVDMIEDVYQNSIHRPEQVVAFHGDSRQ